MRIRGLNPGILTVDPLLIIRQSLDLARRLNNFVENRYAKRTAAYASHEGRLHHREHIET